MWSQAIQRTCRVQFQRLPVLFTRRNSTRFRVEAHQKETDSLGIPVHPTWSVEELLTSYPKPTITSSTLKHLHDLSALTPPDEGTEAHAKLTSEMENLIKLVEAVKLVNVDHSDSQIPDGRIWVEGVGIELSEGVSEEVDGEICGRALLCHARRISLTGHYLVESDRPK